MLVEFKVANFRSIREEQTFSLVAGNVDRDRSECLIEPNLPGLAGIRLLKGAAIYGANASGKSNILSALAFVAGLVKNSATRLGPGDETGTKPFKLDRESVTRPSAFELTFVAEGTRYLFGLAVTPARVTEEYLVAYPKGAPQRWYHRTFNPAANAYEWARPSTSFKQDRALQEKTRENSLFLSVGPQFNHPQLTPVFGWFKQNLRFLNLAESWLLEDFTAQLIEQPAHRNRIVTLLQKADVGIVDATVEQKEIELEKLRPDVPPRVFDQLGKTASVQKFDIHLFHGVDGQDAVSLDFDDEESAGTRRFFSLIGPWTDILDNGYTVFIDEIEASLHPILVRELLRLLLCNENNTKGAQVVFTTHNPVLLEGNLLRRDQVWFTEKTSVGATRLYPLTDYQPRKDEALAKGYLAGRYGGIPFIPEGLKP